MFGVLALFVAVGGTGAYAANTVFSSDIVNGEVKSADIGSGQVTSANVKDDSISTFDVHILLGADIVNNTLTGADIDESTLGQVPSAADSDKLDGIDSSGFVQGGATVKHSYLATGDPQIRVQTSAGQIVFACLNNNTYVVQFVNVDHSNTPLASNEVWRQFTDSAGSTALGKSTLVGFVAPAFFNADTGTRHGTVHARESGGASATWEFWLDADGSSQCKISVTMTAFPN